MTKHKTKGLIINLLAVFLAIAVFLTGIIYPALKFNSNPWLILLYGGIALVVNYVLALILHETGHLICAKIVKMKINFVNFGLFSIDVANGYKLRMFTFFGKNAGESVFLPVKTPTLNDFAIVAFGGIFTTFLYLLGCILTFAIWNSALGYALFLAGSAGVFYLFLVNILPFDKTSDGAILFKSGYIKSVVIGYALLKEIEEGKNPVMPEDLNDSNLPLVRYFRYLFYAKDGEFDKSRPIMEGLYDDLYTLSEEEYDFIFPEVLFIKCLDGKLSEEMDRLADNYFCGDNNSIPIIRAHYAYRKLKGEETWSETIKNSYISMLKTAPPFVKDVEKELGKQVGL